MVAVKPFAAGCAPRLATPSSAGAHEALGGPKAADSQGVQCANAEPIPQRLRVALDAQWRGEMPRTLWIGRDGVREACSGLLTADVLDGGLRHAKR